MPLFHASRVVQNLPSTSQMSSVDSDDIQQEPDEPPDDMLRNAAELQCLNSLVAGFKKTMPSHPEKTSLLTLALHEPVSENNPSSECNELLSSRPHSLFKPPSSSVASSAAELTSDCGLTSPELRAITPSPPVRHVNTSLPEIISDKDFLPQNMISHKSNPEPICGGEIPSNNLFIPEYAKPELGRRRCIKFAGDSKDNNEFKHEQKSSTAEVRATSLLKRPCMVKFACPNKPAFCNSAEGKLNCEQGKSPRQSTTCLLSRASAKSRRDSDSTIRKDSPKILQEEKYVPGSKISRRGSNLRREEATRFHEFASSEEEVDEWIQETLCHQNRLTVNDTLKVENSLRHLGEEAEEEALQELDDEDVEEDDEEDVEDEGGDSQLVDVFGSDSDDGFQTDNEEGFASSDDSDAGSDYQWWAPGVSTAATSVEFLEHIRPSRLVSSVSSVCSANSNSGQPKVLGAGKSPRPMKIRPHSPELPDSTDFVCGTFDEDRPLEAAYLSCLEKRKALKHRPTPQDIDPTFPNSDPEMEEEESDDFDVTQDSDQHLLIHGSLEPHLDPEGQGHLVYAKRRPLTQSPKHIRLLASKPCHSPAPPLRYKSPPASRRSSAVLPKRANLHVHFEKLAQRPVPVQSTSLPRTPAFSEKAHVHRKNDNRDMSRKMHSRGAIDIVKGLEKKRQRRKEMLFQKHCRKPCKDKERRPQPGKGAERMREVGMELAAYKGKRVGPPKRQAEVLMLSY